MKILLLILIAFSVFVGLVMKFYKKSLRKDKADTAEITSVAWAFSVLFGIVTYLITSDSALPKELVSSPLLILLYSVLIRLFQLPACQAIWKPILKACTVSMKPMWIDFLILERTSCLGSDGNYRNSRRSLIMLSKPCDYCS